jgi:hypothetical protein
MWVEEEEYLTQTTSYPIYTINTSLTDSTIDEDTFLENFLQNQYPNDVKIEGINDDNRSEISAENNRELWTYLFTAEIEDPTVKTIEISPAKTLKINNKLTSQQEQKLLDVLKINVEAFAWDYKDMKGIHPSICTHHIYIKEDCKPIRKPQRRMNPAMKDIVKQELQKLLDVGFIYPISDSEWVSPLVIVPKKNGKWRICVYYRELNKATRKDHFPLPFIDQVLDVLAGK